MKKLLILSTLLFLGLAHADNSKPLSYVGAIITMIADPEITWDENPHEYTAIKLSKPQNISGDTIDHDGKDLYLNVVYMQLVSNDNLAKKYKGKGLVKLTCSDVYTAHTGHHYTDLLCVVDSIKLFGK